MLRLFNVKMKFKLIILFLLFFGVSCTAYRVLSTSENGNIQLKQYGYRKIDQPNRLDGDIFKTKFADNGNIYILQKSGEPIVGFNKQGRSIYNTNPNVIYASDDFYMLENGNIIGLMWGNYPTKDWVGEITQFDKKGKLIDNWFEVDQNEFSLRTHSLHILPDSSIIISGYDNFKKTLYGKFKYPNSKLLTTGGGIGPAYIAENGESIALTESIISDSSLFFIVSTSPFIREMDLELNYMGMKGVKGKHYRLSEELEENPNFGFKKIDDNDLFGQWFYENRRTMDIFHHGNYACVIYREVTGDEDRNWCQVYSKDFEIYYGEILLPEKPLGDDNKYIYFKSTKNGVNRISKTKLKVKK